MSKKVTPPYHFVPVTGKMIDAAPSKVAVSNHGDNQQDLFSGELYCEVETLTPSIFGNFQSTLTDSEYSAVKNKFGENLIKQKKVIRPQIIEIGKKKHTLINGSTLMGLARNNLAALSFAPMTRVQEKSFSFRPNASFPDEEMIGKKGKKPTIKTFSASIVQNDDNGIEVEVFYKVDTAKIKHKKGKNQQEFDHLSHIDKEGYLSKLHTLLHPDKKTTVKDKAYISSDLIRKGVKNLKIPYSVISRFNTTTEHLCCEKTGHLSSSNPLINQRLLSQISIGEGKNKRNLSVSDISKSIRDNRNLPNWKKDMLIYVEVKVDEDGIPKEIISFGNNFRYRWIYNTTTTLLEKYAESKNNKTRKQVMPFDFEMDLKPSHLSMVNSLFGITREGESGTLRKAGKVNINHAIEVLDDTKSINELDYWVALKQSGQPNPGAYEFYLSQNTGREINTYDDKRILAGRKFYWHQEAINKNFEAQTRVNGVFCDERNAIADLNALLARNVCPAGKRFRFTLRFKELTKFELGGLIVSLSPQMVKEGMKKCSVEKFKELSEKHDAKIAVKIGYGRPQGFGSASISIIKAHAYQNKPGIECSELAAEYFNSLYKKSRSYFTSEHSSKEEAEIITLKNMVPTLSRWLSINSLVAGQSADYPRLGRNGDIFNYHKNIRDSVCKLRKYEEAGFLDKEKGRVLSKDEMEQEAK